MTEKIHRVEFTDEFRHCPICGYQDGFHTMLRKTENETLWLFICPSCHEIFDIGRTVD